MIDVALLNEIDCVAHWVRFYRKAKGWSQQTLAVQAGVKQARISELERGVFDPQLGTLAKVAGAFGIPVSHLLTPIDSERLEKSSSDTP